MSPNPANNYVNIGGEENLEKVEIQLFDLSGNIVSKNYTKNIPVGYLTPGLY